MSKNSNVRRGQYLSLFIKKGRPLVRIAEGYAIYIEDITRRRE